LSRRAAVLMAARGMAVLMLALASVAWAAPGPPTVVSTVPTDGATGVDVNANIKVTVSEEMKARSINTNTFYGCGSSPEACLDGCATSSLPTPLTATLVITGCVSLRPKVFFERRGREKFFEIRKLG
jgi:Bacterial Ig-like domain